MAAKSTPTLQNTISEILDPADEIRAGLLPVESAARVSGREGMD
jgi:hypothetical protein